MRRIGCPAPSPPPSSPPGKVYRSCVFTMSPPRARPWRCGMGHGAPEASMSSRHSLRGSREPSCGNWCNLCLQLLMLGPAAQRHSGGRGEWLRLQPKVPQTGEAVDHMARRYFGTDGIRGLANSAPMTSEIALKVGMAAGKLFSSGTHRHRVVIGKDTRLSGYMIESALMSGFTAVGMDVFLLGPMPTPAVAMLTRSLRADLGVMISASHNPSADNGIKLFDPDGYKLSDEAEAQIEALMEAPSGELLAPAERIGRAKRIESAQERYIEYAKRTLARNIRLNDLRVVIDCANGAGYQVAPDALWELGAEVVKIGVEPNGHNINYKCGSTAPEALCDKVREIRADIGIALDGDADRVVIVDEKGKIVDGDQIMAVIAESWHRRGKLSAGGIVATVMSNLGLERYLHEIGLALGGPAGGDRCVIGHIRRP